MTGLLHLSADGRALADALLPPRNWVEAMRAGAFEQAWMISDQALAELCRAGPPKHVGPRHLQRIWRGEDLAGKRVLVRCYHGLGDTIQFLRFMPALRSIARSVTLWCQAELLPLAQRIVGIDCAMPLHDGTPDIDYEVDIEIMEVPHAIRAGRADVEMRRQYLALPPAVGPTLGVVKGDVTVGLVWEVGDWDKRRAIPAHLLRRLVADGVMLCSLQPGAAGAQLGEIGAKDVSTPDISALGHRMQALDLIICVDTMTAHLAGALGCEAWVLLHSDCDWRWPESGNQTLWYPSLRLFHQRTAGDWACVIEDVRAALLERVRLRRSSEEYASLSG